MNKINFAQKITAVVAARKRKGSFDRSIMHPEREWFIGLSLVLIILLGSVYWSVVRYNQYSNVTTSETSDGDELLIYKNGLVKSALVDFAKRAEEYEAVKAALGSNIVVSDQVEESPVEVTSDAPEEIIIDENDAEVEPKIEPGLPPAEEASGPELGV